MKTADGTSQTIEGKAIVIATGSDVARLPGIEIDEQRIVSSTGALVLDKVPQRLLVIGAGVIGLELGSVWRRLGSEVIVVEFLDRILPGMDSEVCRQFQRMLRKAGHHLQAVVQGHRRRDGGKEAQGHGRAGRRRRGGSQSKPTSCWCRSGACPSPRGSGSKTAGVKMDNKGRVIVDARFATNVPGIYAIGDAIAGPMLAHKAQDEGVAVAEILAGRSRPRELRRHSRTWSTPIRRSPRSGRARRN